MALKAAINATMRGVAWFGQPYNVSVIDMPMPTIVNQTDVVVRMTSAGICGSDLHFYHGFSGADNVPWGLGHEGLGYVTEVGSAVSFLSPGDYVVIPDNGDDGHWGQQHPLSFGSGRPNYGGLQAEYVRVPFADKSLIPIPLNGSETSSKTELDYLMLADIFPTAWSGLTETGFEAGDSVAVFGAGPVGLLAAYSALLRGASRVYSIDHVRSRLDLAASIGAIPIDLSASDPVDQILAQETDGVTRAVDCVGFEAVNATGEREDGIVIRNMIRVTKYGGGFAIVGVYTGHGNSSVGAPYADQLPSEFPVPIPEVWSKALRVGSGIALPLAENQPLLDLIAAGKASPSFIVSAEIGIEQAPEYYRRFSDHVEQKVVIRFPRD